jgi:peptidoglycan/xylan/chitin deacetylase (PgdA/CDA1 family)
MRWPDGFRAAVSLSFDDARPSQLVFGLPALDAHGVKATFYVTVQAMKLRLDDWKRAVANGHEIGNHTMNHPCSGNYEWMRREHILESYTIERIAEDIAAADDEIEKMLGLRTKTFAYPCGQKFVGREMTTQSYVPVIAKRFIIGRGFNDTTANDPAYFDRAQTLGVDMDMQSFEQLQPQIDAAAERGAWLVLVGHDVGKLPTRQTTLVETIDGICRYCRENRIWLDTLNAVGSHLLQPKVARGA